MIPGCRGSGFLWSLFYAEISQARRRKLWLIERLGMGVSSHWCLKGLGRRLRGGEPLEKLNYDR